MRRFGRIYDGIARQRLAPRARSMRFRRQVLLGPFIVDFFAPSASLVVEVDGGIHQAQVHQDALRDAALHARGLRVVRIDAELVLHDVARAIAKIRSALAP